MLSCWGNSSVESISQVFRFTFCSVARNRQSKGTIHLSCFCAYFRINLITPQQSPLLGRICETTLDNWYSCPYTCPTLVENTPIAFHEVSCSISLALNHSYLNPMRHGSFQKGYLLITFKITNQLRKIMGIFLLCFPLLSFNSRLKSKDSLIWRQGVL